MPAPPAKWLWEARNKAEWGVLYGRWLGQWEGREYLQGEFGRVREGVMLDERTEMWLEDAGMD